MGTPKTPAAPDPNKSYQEGIDVYLKNLPTLLDAEQSARDTYDAPSIEANLARQDKYGPRLIEDALARLGQVDPTGQAVREKLGQSVTAGLASGTGLPDEFRSVMTGFQASAGADRGGGGGGTANPEDIFKGSDALAYYQARLGNVSKFLAGPTPGQQMQLIPQVAADRSSGYVNMNAGAAGQQFALQNYQNVLAANDPRNPANMNAWQRAVNGASIGASQGSVGGGWGALGGALGGAGHGALNTPDYQWNANNAYNGG